MPDKPAGTGRSRCRNNDPSRSKYYPAVEDHRRVGGTLHRQVSVYHGVAERSADIALHHAAEAVIARPQVDADVVDLVLKRLQRVTTVGVFADRRLELAAVGPATCVRRDAAHLVVRAVVLPHLD